MAEAIAPISMRIEADLSDFGPKLKSGADDVDSFASRSKASLEGLKSSFQSATSSASSLFASFASGGFGGAFSQATSQVEGLVSKLAGGSGAFGTFAAAGVAAATAVGVAVARTTSQIGELNRLSKTLGTNNQDTQVIQDVFRRGGFDDDGARATALRFSAHIGEAAADSDSPQARAFQRIRLDPERLAERDLLNALQQTFQQLRGITNRPERDAASMAIFGRNFTDIQAIVARPDSIQRSRDSVAVGGITDEQANRVAATAAYRRETEDIIVASGGSMLQKLGRAWNDFATLFDEESARYERRNHGVSRGVGIGIDVLTGGGFTVASALTTATSSGRPQDVANGAGNTFLNTILGRTPTTAVPIDAYTDNRQSRADLAAQRLAQTWQDEAETFTRSALAATALRRSGIDTPTASETRRQRGIMDAERDSTVTPAAVSELRVRNEILSNLERRAQVEADLVGITNRTRTSYENFQDTLANLDRLQRRIGEGPDSERENEAGQFTAINRARAQAFMTLRSSLGRGPSSYAMSGLDPRSMEGAKFAADLEVRSRLPDRNSDEGVRSDVEQGLELQRQQLQEMRDINRALDRLGPLPPAPSL
jgi:hypothetical protein